MRTLTMLRVGNTNKIVEIRLNNILSPEISMDPLRHNFDNKFWQQRQQNVIISLIIILILMRVQRKRKWKSTCWTT